MTPRRPNQLVATLDPLRPPRTFADYAAVAIGPVLIVVFVGAFTFFLLEIGYAGSNLGKLRWTLFWFVLAMVFISRIAIEKGYDHAGVYSLGLAAATGLVLTQYVNNYLGAWCILGLIWWATNKLTWDCTVVDDDSDASGEGLLQAAKLDLPQPASGSVELSPPAGQSQGRAAKSKSKPAWWKLVYQAPKKAAAQPHAPGLWVLYFSLAALPIFGVGQALVPSSDAAAQLRVLVLLTLYLAAGLGLLLITSFLGLRRYLRQRHLVMPAAISVAWVSRGASLALGVLLVALLLPRPNTSWQFGALMDRFGDPSAKVPERSTSNRSGATSSQGEKGSGTQADSSAPGQGAPERQVQGDSSSARTEPEISRSEGQGSSDRSATPNFSQPKPASAPGPTPTAPAPSGGAPWFKIISYAVIIIAALWISWKNRRALSLLLRQVCEMLVALWRRIFGLKGKPVQVRQAKQGALSQASFASYRNPFRSGEAAGMSAPELVVYTFNALEAWAAWYRIGRDPRQTPFEFASHLVEQAPELSFEVDQLARWYVQVAYGAVTELPACKGILEVLWSKMGNEALPRSAA